MRTVAIIVGAWLPLSAIFGVAAGRYLREHLR